jgi:hypothetical protein
MRHMTIAARCGFAATAGYGAPAFLQLAVDGSQANVVRKKTFLVHLIEAEQAMKSPGMFSELDTDLDSFSI